MANGSSNNSTTYPAIVEDKTQESQQINGADDLANDRQRQSQSKSSTTKTITTTIHTTTTKSALSNGSFNPSHLIGSNSSAPSTGDTLSMAIVEDLGKKAAVDSFVSIRRNMSRQSQHQSSPAPAQQQQQQYSTNNSKNKQPIGSPQNIQDTATTTTIINQEDKRDDSASNRCGPTSGAREETVDGNRLVTTISTVAAQSGQSRIVLALLKDGDSLQIKLQEMRPGIFEVGTNYKECVKYFEEHQKLMRNLRKQTQTPIECWMKKYEKIAATKEPNMSTERKLVYICMAENLQGCWKTLLNQLDKRSHLLDEACKFYESTEQLVQALNRADNHVQVFRKEFLNGPTSTRFNQACNELKTLNQQVLEAYNIARKNQQQLVDLISIIGTGNLGDVRVNHLISDAQALINYINTYIDPLERRKIQLESVITTTTTTTTIDRNDNNNKLSKRSIQDQTASYNDQNDGYSNNNTFTTKTTTIIREISNFNDLNLVENWLNLKIEQLNSSLLSSLGVSVSDSKSVLSKHDQIALECRAIEEATLTFNGRNIHAIKALDPKDDKIEGDKSLFDQQKLLANRVRDVITILDARIVLLRRTIDFYLRSKDATGDIAKMMRRLQVDNSLQSVHFVSNELDLKDVSSVVASGATIISELQQLQLAQQHGQRSRIVNLSLVTSGIRAIIDQLNQDLAHLKTVLNQRKLVLLNEDATKMANNFSNKCHQLHFWLNNHVKSFLLANNRLGNEPDQVRAFCDSHEKLRVGVQNKTLEVEALLRSLPTLTENFDANSNTADIIQRDTDELRQDWINVTNCLDKRIELAKKYLALLNTVKVLSKELDSLERFNKGRPSTPDERTDEDIRSNIGQSYVQLSNQVKNFNLDAQKNNTELVYSSVPALDGKPIVNDINKQQLVDHSNNLLAKFTDRKQAVTENLDSKRLVDTKLDPAHQRPQQVDPPRFTRVLSDRVVEPFSTVELECETDDGDCQIEWFMNNFKKIPAAIKHLASSENNQHKLTISNFSPICCGTYVVRASNGAGQAVSQCRLRLLGIKETHEAHEQVLVNSNGNKDKLLSPMSYNNNASSTMSSIRQQHETIITTTQQNFQSSSPAVSTTSSFSQWRPSHHVNGQAQTPSIITTAPLAASNNNNNNNNNKTISRIIQGVESSCEPDDSDSINQRQTTVKISQLASDSDTDTTMTRDRTPQFPITHTTYSGQPSSSQQGNNNNSATTSNRLRVTNYTIESPVSSATLSRSVSKSPFEGTPQPPVFVQGLTDTMPRCCSRAGLVCLVVGNPPPTIEWLHNNTTIATTKCPKSTTCPRGNICKLTIETMNNRTQGQYVCKASNRIGQTSTGLTLTK